jgi:ParB family transcriptional regulator, chromosome partitioning protein
MAKRRKIAAPSAEDLDRMEEDFRRETAARAGTAPLALAPIAEVASESAGRGQPLPPEIRETQARDRTDAERLREAESKGLVMVDMPLGWIDEGVMVRDRIALDPEEMTELKRSILSNGLRLPIEVYDKGPKVEAKRFGLISGFRRLRAMRELHAEHGFDHHGAIRAVVRDPADLGGAIVAMVEENEIRTQLTHYERGRIAVIAAQQGTYGSVEEAVNTLFGAASKAKRSKIRSFALIYEELGDMLEHGEDLREKDGLRLAQVLRQGGEGRLREALDAGSAGGDEWSVLEPVVTALESGATAGKGRGGRPRSARRKPSPGWVGRDTLKLANGITLEYGEDNGAHVLRLRGRGVDGTRMREVIEELARLLN